ncbi:MAG: glycosyltransferase family 9 protein [Bacteroidota bacterium]
MKIPQNIILSRTDSIGDVVLSLPLAKVLKSHFPEMKIAFMGRSYTQPIIESCIYVDEFINLNDFLKREVLICKKKPEAILHVFPVSAIAKRAKQLYIPLRIGTTNRLYHWTTCNELIRLSRKKSDLHEAQLNLKLLETFGIEKEFSLTEIGNLFGLEKLQKISPALLTIIKPNKYNLILHPKSQGSAREWGLDNFIALINLLDTNKFNIIISGTAKERELIQPIFDAVGDKVTDICGLMTLSEFISFIHHCDGLVANSTGPLHIAAALGKDAIGIYPPMRPIHPGRWAPLGPKAQVFVQHKECNDCKGNDQACKCIMDMPPKLIYRALEEAQEQKSKASI